MSAARTTGTPPVIPGFRFVSEIAASRYSAVMRYRQDGLDRDVAVKVLTDIGHGAAMRDQRNAEASAIARLDRDPRIAQVLIAGVAPDGRHYLIMPFYPGPHLPELMGQGRLDVRRVLRLGVEVAQAVRAVHAVGLLHGDIKPANILLDQHGPHLSDFGLAEHLGDDRTSEVIGMSLPWSAPEVVAGGKASDASDVYSLGATLWNLLVGRSPYDVRGDNSMDAVKARVERSAPPPTGRVDVPAALESLLAEMMARMPAARPSADAVVARLTGIETAHGGPVTATAPWHTTGDGARAGRLDGDATWMRPFGAADADPTRLKDSTPAPRPLPADPPRGRASWWLWGTAVAVVGAVAAGVLVANAGGGSPTPRRTVDTGGTEQDAGSVGGDVPRGVPVGTATRLNATTLRFAWTYTGKVDTDTYRWQTADGARTGIAAKATVDVADPAGTELCLQVKVIRSDGGPAAVDWSPVGCGE